MLATLGRLRRPLIALVAIFAASLTASDAAACSTMKQDRNACRTVCGCCTAESTHTPATRADEVASPTPASCETSPGEGCSCRSQEPAAPTPKPYRASTEGRPEFGPASLSVQLGEEAAARDLLTPQVIPTQDPPKIPLYLRHARLLF